MPKSVALCLFSALAIVCLLYPSQLLAGRIEAGAFTAHDTSSNSSPVTVSFQEPFDTTPVVIALIGVDETDPAKIRITNVTTTGFQELIVEPDGADGAHGPETIHYVAVEPGRHVLPGGAIIEAGFSTVTAIQHGTGPAGTESWQNISYSAALPGTPVVLAHLQTANSETASVASAPSAPFLTTTIQNANGSSFQVALERSESVTGPVPSAETVGWIAFPTDGSGTFPNTSGTPITWSSINTAINIRGYQNGCFTNGFGQTSASAIVVAKKSSHRGGDGGWIRRCSQSASDIGLTVDEDTSQNAERSHIVESAAIIAFNQAFHADLAADLTTTKVKFGTTGSYGDFDLPGATVEYTINVNNQGNAPPNYDTVVVTDALPADLALIVTDFAGGGSGPVQFTDGSPTSNLTCTFVSLTSTSDCFSFSTDGSDFGYAPSDSGDGTDPAVTHVRVTPTGAMAGDTGSGAPSFEIRLRARIK